MVMGHVGKVRSFKVSPRLLFWSIVFLALYFPFSIVVTNWWMDLKRETEEQRSRIDKLEQELFRSERSLFKFQQHVALLDGYIASLEMGKGLEGASDNGVEEENTISGTESATDEPLSDLVDIQRMTIDKDNRRLKVAFNLVNIFKGDEPVSGYVHVLASGRDRGNPWWEIYPRGEVEKGMPAKYRVGHPFIIQRFKPIRAQFHMRPGGPDSIRVVVYDEKGRLIYLGSFDVDEAS